MTENENMIQWQEANERYLSAALNWLRLKLRRLADSVGDDAAPAAEQAKTDAEIAEAAAVTAEAEKAQSAPALVILCRRFGLSPFERDVLLLCIAMELDTRTPGLCARAQSEPNRGYPTFALAMALFDQPAWDVLSAERPLRYWRLIDVNPLAAQSLIMAPLRADTRIVNYIKGLNTPDDRLPSLLAPFDVPEGDILLPPSQQQAVETVVRRIRQSIDGKPPPVTQLTGLDSVGKQLVARRAAFELGLNLYRIPTQLLPASTTELEALARLWQRESFLLPVALYLDAHDYGAGDKSGNGDRSILLSLHRFMARTGGIFFISTREIWSDLGSLTTVVEVRKPTAVEQREVWAASLEEAAASDTTVSVAEDARRSPPLLAGQFNLNVTTIREIVERAAGASRGNGEAGNGEAGNGGIQHDGLWDDCLMNTGPKLDTLAQRLDPRATWDDIVLSDETVQLLHCIADQVSRRSTVYDDWGFRAKMNRGLGISALFTGDSGTGKTMAAEVIANELRLNLYRIDLSGVVSKYIGETEKNLRRLFDAAEDGGAILFFDEADALFGKRSEVKDSHDRYANIEINYLLQRMESYNGLAILATNMKSALDEAFVRRLRFIVNFPFPGLKERKMIFRKVFPAGVPRTNLDYQRLAGLNLAGGSIHNIAVNAAFMAAREGVPVSMPLVLNAARIEFRKTDRPIKEKDFRWTEPGRTV